MVYTAAMVAVTDFLIGVLSALVLYALLYRFLNAPAEARPHLAAVPAAGSMTARSTTLGGSTNGAAHRRRRRRAS